MARERTRSEDSHDDRRIVLVLLGIGAIASNLFVLCIWSWWAFGTQNGFADLTIDMLKDKYVRDAVAEQIVDAMENEAFTAQAATTARPFLEPVVSAVVGTDAFKGFVYAGARQLHRTVFRGHESRMQIEVDDAVGMVKESLAVIRPDLAESIDEGTIELAVGFSQNRRLDTIMRTARFTGWLIWPFGALVLGAFGTAIALSRDRRRTILRIGLLLMAVGLVLMIILVAGAAIVSRFVEGPDTRAAVRAVYRSITHVLMLTTRVVLNVGIVVTLASLVAGEERVRSRLRTAADWIRAEWAQPRLHLLIGGLIAMAGVLIAVYPSVMVELVARTIGLAIALMGLVAVLDVVGAHGWSGAGDGREIRTVRHVVVVGGATCAAILTLLAFGGLALYRSLNATNVVAPDPDNAGCNGYVELCDRPLDTVVLAGTHNAMASSREHFYTPRQTGGIGAQLAAGVRAFLLDAYYGTDIGGTIYTDFGSEAERAEAEALLTPEEVAVLEGVLGPIGGASKDEPEVYFCHLYCELGADFAEETFQFFNDYLAENPNEVVVLIIEDWVAPADLDAALRASHLDRRLFHYDPEQALPTLRELIETRHNVVLMTEYEAGPAESYPHAYSRLLRDTEYDFESVTDFDCSMKRGSPSNDLLLMNHWVATDPPDPSVAAEANAADVLMHRVEACRDAWGQVPNIIAVDFYASGDVVEVVDQLNLEVPAA